MEALVYLVPVLGCGLMMAACMFLMGRMTRGHGHQAGSDDEVRALREQVARLRAEADSSRAEADG